MSETPSQLPGGKVDATAARKRPGVGRHLRSAMITGLLTLIPLFVTLYILQIFFSFLTKYTQPLAKVILTPLYAKTPSEALVDWAASALALVISIVLIYVMGLLGNFVVGRRLLDAVEHFIENLPL